MLKSHNIDIVFVSDVKLTDGLTHPALRDRYFKNRMTFIQLYIVQNMICAVADCRPCSKLLLWIYNFTAPFLSRNFA